jgi:hypothetical protein
VTPAAPTRVALYAHETYVSVLHNSGVGSFAGQDFYELNPALSPRIVSRSSCRRCASATVPRSPSGESGSARSR